MVDPVVGLVSASWPIDRNKAAIKREEGQGRRGRHDWIGIFRHSHGSLTRRLYRGLSDDRNIGIVYKSFIGDQGGWYTLVVFHRRRRRRLLGLVVSNHVRAVSKVSHLSY